VGFCKHDKESLKIHKSRKLLDHMNNGNVSRKHCTMDLRPLLRHCLYVAEGLGAPFEAESCTGGRLATGSSNLDGQLKAGRKVSRRAEGRLF
jgi:hypothetical protein